MMGTEGSSTGAADAGPSETSGQTSGGESTTSTSDDPGDDPGDGSSGGGDEDETGAEDGSTGWEPSDPLEPFPHECAAHDETLDIPPCTALIDDENEPNDEPGTANPLCFDHTVSGHASTQESDWFDITVPDAPYGGVVVLTAVPEVDGRLDVDVFTAEGHGEVDSFFSVNDGEHVVGWFAAAPSTAYRVLVEDRFGATDYSLSAQWVPTIDCYEPNDTRDTAKGIVAGETIEAKLIGGWTSAHEPDEAADDWYKVRLESGEVTVTLEDGGIDTPHRIALFDALGDQVAQDVSAGPGATATFTTSVERGDYTVRVYHEFGIPTRGDDDLADNVTNDYELTVSQD